MDYLYFIYVASHCVDPLTTVWIPHIDSPEVKQAAVSDCNHMVVLPHSQGLSPYRPPEAPGGSKVRDPGNEVDGSSNIVKGGTVAWGQLQINIEVTWD